MPTYTTPGVYIIEAPANGPIVGVGTSTTAFIGAALQGPLFEPTLITNWTRFVTLFGSYMIGPSGFYMAYAVKGFFDNGGTSAYIVRVGTAQTASLTLVDRGSTAGEALLVSAQQAGLAGNQITVAVTDAQIVSLAQDAVVTQFHAPITSASASNVLLTNITDAASFSPGDIVTIEGTTERATIARIVGANLILQTALTGSYTTNTVRIADLQVDQTTFRVTNHLGLEPGSVIELANGTSTGSSNEYQVINAVSGSFVTLQGTGLAHTYSMDTTAAAVTVQSLEFTMAITSSSNPSENWQDLSMDPRHSHYWGTVVQSAYVTVSPPAAPSVQNPPLNRPADIAATNLAGGVADNPSTISSATYGLALQALVPIQDVELVCVPDRTDQAVQTAVVAHCETMMDRFAILQSAPGSPPTADTTKPLMKQREWCESDGPNQGGGGYAAFYYPWIQIPDPSGAGTILVPPCGHMAGIYARSDSVGVQNAPANLTVKGSVGLEVNVDSVTQGQLNIAGINVIRIFPGQALPVVWGARTTAPAPPRTSAWAYINVRRLFIYVETSLKYGLQPYVFQTNDTGLWKRLNRTITNFLTGVWQSGALFGAKASQAFYLEIDDENNPPASQALGQVNITIGMAPVYPAEFVIVTIGMWDSGISITEQ